MTPDDMAIYDSLPPAVRKVMRDAVHNIAPRDVAAALDRVPAPVVAMCLRNWDRELARKEAPYDGLA